jgi:hypothetical protein
MERAIPLAPRQNDATQVAGSIVRLRLALIALGLCAVAGWLLQHSYSGIVHDSVLYTLFALAKLHPHLLDNDIFLRFGSQDRYTIFTPLYAAAISAVGLEHAAVLLTFVSQAALSICAWLLARQFMSPLAATLGVALLAVVPGEYGAGDMFHYLEGFLTPRLPAEALALGALVAACTQRYRTAACCIIIGMLLHPIMAAAAAAMLILTFVVPLRPKFAVIAAGALFVSSLVTLEAIAPLSRLDETWLSMVRETSAYLFVSSWTLMDWSRCAVPWGILAVGWAAGTAPLMRRICVGSLLTVACGLAINLLYCVWLHVSIFTDLQSWRWVWLADVLALVLLPVIAQDCWRRGASGQVAVVLLASAWVLRDSPAALYIVPLAVACAAVPEKWSNQQYWRLVVFGSWAGLALALANDVIDRLSYMPLEDLSAPVLPQKLHWACLDGIIPGALMVGAWLVLRRSQSTARNSLVAAAAALACAGLVPLGWESWTQTHYTPALASKFAPWRAEIPLHAEVIWPDLPIGAWYLLQRPNYWSLHQEAGAIFSREKALLMRRRTQSVAAALKASQLSASARDGTAKQETDSSGAGVAQAVTKWNRAGMEAACADPDLQYIVSWQPVAPTPFAPVTIDPTKHNGKLYLYRCADLRS